MSPPPDSAVVPSDAALVADRYRRLERVLSGTLAVSVGLLGGVAVLVLPLLPALGAVGALLVLFRLPVFRTAGTATLTTDASPETVRSEFGGPTPPVLPFQWGIADTVRATGSGAEYAISYLFGLRSVTVTVETAAPADGSIDLVIQAGDHDWATYTVSVHDREGRTTVDVEWSSDRRFGLRRLPQTLLARRLREEALGAQGYTTVRRDVSLFL